jgi:predicted nucleic-acid-binding Zn-ribbon protein
VDEAEIAAIRERLEEESMYAKNCPVCGQTSFGEGVVEFRQSTPRRMTTVTTEALARTCRACGHMQLFAALDSRR